VELRVIEHRAPLDVIFDHGLAGARRAKTNRIVAAGAFVGQRKLRRERQVAAFAVVAGLAMLAVGLLALCLELFGGASTRGRLFWRATTASRPRDSDQSG